MKCCSPGQVAVNGQITWTDSLIKYADIGPAPRRIVGVSADVDDANIIPQRNMTIYQPFAQGPRIRGPPGRAREEGSLRARPDQYQNRSYRSCH